MTRNIFLPARPPFSLRAVAESHGWHQLAPFDWAPSEGLLTYVHALRSGRVMELSIRQRADGVVVEVADGLTESEGQELGDQVRWMLQLDQDLSVFYALAKGETRLAHLEAAGKGRILRAPTLFEDVVKTILTTNVQWSGTVRMVEALVHRFGALLPPNPDRHAFPTPKRLSVEGEEALRAAGLGYRAPYVVDLARSIVSGECDLEGLKGTDQPTDELRRQLLAIKGVGDYAAASLLMLLGRYDFIPVDSWARTMVSRTWYDGAPVGRAEVEAAFERWGRWQGLAYWFWDWGRP